MDEVDHSLSVVVVLSTILSQEVGQKLAKLLVNRRLAACVQISSSIQSTYIWNEKIIEDQEFQLVIKTTNEKLSEVEQVMESEHPYEVAEFVVVHPTYVSQKYLTWIETTT